MRWVLFLSSFFIVISVRAQDVSHERLLANLRLQIPELEEVELTIGDIEASPYGDLKQGSFTINGRQTIQFLLSEDLGHLILLTAPPIDVNLTLAEVDKKLAEQAVQDNMVASESNSALSRFASGRPSLGPDDAPITIYEFSDFQCSFCGRASKVVKQILDKYPEKIRFVYLHFPLDMHEWAIPAAIAAECAARQSHSAFWVLHDNFFESQSEISKESLVEKAHSWLADSSIDLDVWQDCATNTSNAANQRVSLEIDISLATGKRFGVTGTPVFFVNGHRLTGSRSIEEFDALIAKVAAEI